jgi:hypothetical protein
MMLVRRVLEAGAERVPKEPDCADCGLHGAEFCWVCLGRMEKERDEARAAVETLRAAIDERTKRTMRVEREP